MAHPQLPARAPFKLTILAAQAACAWAVLTPVSIAWSQAASAAQAASDPQTVTVTARKREERGQDVPQSLNVFSGAALEASGVTQLEDLQYRTPGLKVTGALGSSISIRGVSNNASARGGSASTAVHLDGVYIPRPEMALGEVFDLNRIEVLKGPEGTLYGRNATAGVINYLSRDPGRGTGFDGFIGGGTFGLLRGQAGVSLALGEQSALRISAVHSKDDGYTKNIGTGGGKFDARDFTAVRLKGVFGLTPDLRLKLTVQGSDDKGTLGLGASHNPETTTAFVFDAGAPQRESPRRIRLDTAPSVSKRGTLVSATVEAALGSGLDFKSITGLVNYRSRSAADADGVGGFIENSAGSDRSRFVSQEFQLSGRAGKAFSWTSGLYVSQEKTTGKSEITDSNYYPVDLSPLPLFEVNYDATARNSALFGEGTWQFTDQLSLLVGARYSRERQQGASNGFVLDFTTFAPEPFAGDRTVSSNRFTPKALLQYKLDRDTMAYASVTTGFKSGGINFNPPVATYRPEKITSYEVGTKMVRGGGALEFDAAAFYYDYTDLQLRTVVGNQTPISNAAKATVKGVEFTLVSRPMRDLSLDLNAAYVDSALKGYISPATRTDLSGTPLPMTPKGSATAGAEYRFSLAGGSLSLRGEVNHQTTVIFPAFQNTSFERQDALTLVNANLRYTFASSSTYLALIGRNLTDKTYLSNRNYARGFYDLQTFAAPRTVELRLGTRF
jgi:iron complex outermembrane receptor protein